jgi:hypothetical protein
MKERDLFLFMALSVFHFGNGILDLAIAPFDSFFTPFWNKNHLLSLLLLLYYDVQQYYYFLAVS